MPATGSDPEVAAGFDDEVATVGGGPAGCSAVRRCAHLENYRGFPAGIDIETLYELMHDHVETAGCELTRISSDRSNALTTVTASSWNRRTRRSRRA